MMSFKKILVPFDDNIRSIEALEYAAMFASGIGAKIIALHIADPKDYHSKSEVKQALSDLMEDQLRPKLNKIQKIYPDIRRIDLQIRGKYKSINQHILDFTKENQIDFLILRSHGLPAESNWELHFNDTSAYQLVLEAPCPVFTFTRMPSELSMKNILIALDLGEGSIYKVPLALTLAKQFGSTLHLLSSSENQEDLSALEQQQKEVHRSVADWDINTIQNPVGSEVLPSAILHYCKKEDIDLVIIMSRPGFRWSDLWVSPKAKRIISHAKVPVLSIRSKGPYDIGL